MTTRPDFGSVGAGVPLRELIDRHGPLSPESALLVLRESLLSLADAHEHGTVHLDYRPENVLVNRDGGSELSGFDVPATARRPAPYQAPELRDGMPASRASNLYAATAVFFECLTGLAPSPERIMQFQSRQLAEATSTGRAFEPIAGLITTGTAANPADRPAGARDFIARLDDLASAVYGPDWRGRGRRDLAERAAAAPASARNAGRGPLARRRRALYAAAAAAVAVLAAGGTAAALSGHFGSKPADFTANASRESPSGAAATPPASAASAASAVKPSGKAAFTADAAVTPPTATSACAAPVTFKVSGTISAATAGRLTYQWVYSSGAPGPVRALRFSGAGTQRVTGTDVRSRTAGTGWAAIKILSPVSAMSGKATYALDCSARPAAASPAPAATTSTPTAAPARPAATATATPARSAATATPGNRPLVMYWPSSETAGELAGIAGAPYSAAWTARYGTPPYLFTATSLPPGLSINASTGVISGTPTTPGGYVTRVTVTDSGSPAQSSSDRFEFIIEYPPVKIAAVTLPDGTVGTAYPSVTFSATGGDGTYNWYPAADTRLPAGLSLSAGGVLSGTPAAAGTYTVYVSVSDAQPSPEVATAALTLVINPA